MGRHKQNNGICKLCGMPAQKTTSTHNGVTYGYTRYVCSSCRNLMLKKVEQTFRCEGCNWLGYCDTHHKDGNHSNNARENLEILCPNCHRSLHSPLPDCLLQTRKTPNKNMNSKVWVLDSWKTPATNYKESRVGNYRLKKTQLAEGYYPHNCMDGYAFTQVTKPIPMMLLQEKRNGDWCDWMADDPMDYTAMQKYAKAASGKVLTTGLGLGLVVYELLRNKDVEHITVVERSSEVRDLVYHQMPQNGVTLIMSDFWDFVKSDTTNWDMIIVDIWATKGKEQLMKTLREEVLPANDYLRGKYPTSKLVFHGFRSVTDVQLVKPFFAK